MHRRKRRRKAPNVDLNLAAMLDMAFQLLTFFILTFRPAPIEGQLGLHLPPPVALTKVKMEDASGDGSGTAPADVETLDMYIDSNDAGQVSQIKIGLRPILKGRLDKRNQASLNQQLKAMFETQAVPLDRIQLVVDDRLHYEELMKIVDVCTQQVLPNGEHMNRVSFIPMQR